MPTYEYRCGACGHAFEKFQKISDDPVRTCPGCGEDEAERLISSGGGLVFRGSGFYATDYRDSGPRKEQDGGAGDGGADGGSGSGSDDGSSGGAESSSGDGAGGAEGAGGS